MLDKLIYHSSVGRMATDGRVTVIGQLLLTSGPRSHHHSPPGPTLLVRENGGTYLRREEEKKQTKENGRASQLKYSRRAV